VAGLEVTCDGQRSAAAGDDVSGVGVALVGLLLCFAGVRSIHLALLASGFALGWLVSEALGSSVGVAAVVALCAAVVAWAVATFVFRAALFVVGAIAGGVIGAKLVGLLEGDGGSAVLAVLLVLAVGVLVGLATQRFHEPALALACAFGGASLVMSGLSRIAPDQLGFLRTPDTTAEAVIDGAAWILLAAAGWSVQQQWARRRVESRR
jgi:hypothetical protein